jgi:iron-sulfur cluster assembly protein
VIEPVVAITEIAQKQALKVLAKRAAPFLRLGVKGGGCSGLSYVMKPDSAVDARDRTWVLPSGLRVVVDRKSISFLAGTTVDYDIKNLLEGGFRFDNPNAVKSCGCGTSFTPRV